jgi:hypothetical protein
VVGARDEGGREGESEGEREGEPRPGPKDAGPGADVDVEWGLGVDGTRDFLPLPADGRFEMESGPQGGYHIYLQVRQRGLSAPPYSVWTRFVDPTSGQVVRDNRVQNAMVDAGDGWLTFPNALRTFTCPSGHTMFDRDLELVTRLGEDGGWRAERRYPIRLGCPPGDTRCRTNPCTGCAPGECRR